MHNPFAGLLEDRHVKLIARRARSLGFLGQDLDEVLQTTAIRLTRTTIRDDAMILAATNESAADIYRREHRHQRRVERCQQLAICESVDSPDAAVSMSLDVQECIRQLSETDQAICEHLSQGRSIREISVLIGLSVGAVQHHKQRLRQHFTRQGLSEVVA